MGGGGSHDYIVIIICVYSGLYGSKKWNVIRGTMHGQQNLEYRIKQSIGNKKKKLHNSLH